jgi:hypothetical protein
MYGRLAQGILGSWTLGLPSGREVEVDIRRGLTVEDVAAELHEAAPTCRREAVFVRRENDCFDPPRPMSRALVNMAARYSDPRSFVAVLGRMRTIAVAIESGRGGRMVALPTSSSSS